jgi:hypothetical protein
MLLNVYYQNNTRLDDKHWFLSTSLFYFANQHIQYPFFSNISLKFLAYSRVVGTYNFLAILQQSTKEFLLFVLKYQFAFSSLLSLLYESCFRKIGRCCPKKLYVSATLAYCWRSPVHTYRCDTLKDLFGNIPTTPQVLLYSRLWGVIESAMAYIYEKLMAKTSVCVRFFRKSQVSAPIP